MKVIQVMTAAHLNTPAEKMRVTVTQQQIVDRRTQMEKSFIATIDWITKEMKRTYAAQKVGIPQSSSLFQLIFDKFSSKGPLVISGKQYGK